MNVAALPQHRLQPGFLWPERTLWDDVRRHAAASGDGPAIIGEDGTYTYRELVRATERLARHYRELGVRPGDVVVVQMPPVARFVPAFLAVERLEAVVCPVLPGIQGPAFGKIAGLAVPTLVITANSSEDLEGIVAGVPVISTAGDESGAVDMEELLVTDPASALPLPDPPASGVLSELAFTSGTTGLPKGVLHTHATATAGILSTLRRQEVTSGDVVHVALPVGHNFGFFYGVRLALHAGSKLVLQRRWSPGEMLDLCAVHRFTVSSGPPVFLSDLMATAKGWGGRLETLRLFTCAGAKLDADLAAEAVTALPGRISKAFGMTELGHVCSTTAAGPSAKIVTTEGAPHPEIEMRVMDGNGRTLEHGREGELAFRGPFLMVGYQQRRFADAFDDEGFFRTGDLGYADDDGYLVITGRVKNLVIRGGENIPSEAVEQALSSHAMVREVVVVGVPDRRLGERPVACVNGTPGAALTVAGVGAFLERAGIPSIHWPEAIVMMDSIPRTETGKIRRAALRRLATDEARFDIGAANG